MYESELKERLEFALKRRYGIDDFCKTFRYGLVRYILLEEPLNDANMQMRFFLRELAIPLVNNELHYKNEFISFSKYSESSLYNIIYNWYLEVDQLQLSKFNYFQNLEEEARKYRKQAVRDAKPYRDSAHYEQIVKYFTLQRLNVAYNAVPTSPIYLHDLHPNTEHVLFWRTIDEKLQSYVHAVNLKRVDTATITESDIESYIRSNLDEIETGLKIVGQQVQIDDGRIDLLAKDAEGRYVIIELKIEDDKKVIWQSLYYPKQIQKLYRTNDVRMMILAPSFSPSIASVLTDFPHVECYEYTPHVELNKIQKVEIKRSELIAL